MSRKKLSIQPIALGKEATVLDEVTTTSGVIETDFAVLADTVLVSLQASVVSGTLKLDVYTEGSDGVRTNTINFPELAAPTNELLLRKAGATMQRVVVVATYTGACSFIVRVRGTATGEASFKILGANNLVTSQIDINTTPTTVIAATFTDRSTIAIKNYNLSSGVLYIAESAAKAVPATGFPVGPQESFVLDLQAGQEVYGSADAGTIDVRLAETGG